METRRCKLPVISILAAVFLFSGSANSCVRMATASSQAINWECLNLTLSQQAQIKILDKEWQKTSTEIIYQIKYDKKLLKSLLTNPFISDIAIRNLQNRILMNQKKLRYCAMENFLQKRRLLTFRQRQKLHGMLSG